MTPRLRRLLRLVGLANAMGLALLAGLALTPVMGAAPVGGMPFLVVAAVVVGGAALWLAQGLLHQHFEDMKLLHVALDMTARGEVPPEQLQTRWSGEALDEVGQLARLVIDIAGRRAVEQARPDQRLAAVIGALGDAVVVVTASGQVSLVNHPAKALLGEERVAVGTSIYAALDRNRLSAAVEAAQAAGRRPIETTLLTVQGEEIPARITDFGEHRGTVLAFDACAVEHHHEVEVALDLHDLPPAAPAPMPETALEELPAMVLDTETTGLDVENDCIVSIGAVRMHGPRIYRGVTMDCLVNPGRSIPARSTAVHGISSAMVAEAPFFRAVWPDLRAMLQGTVLVGHNIGFDIALLRRACQRAGAEWHDPPWLDVLLLAAALEPDERDLNLESIALRLGVNVSGRHTALGDSLVTAEVYARMLPLLARAGVRSHADAVEFSGRAKHVIAQQREAGW